ncbi:alpha/beta fold hydrolase [Polaromonas sp.]|uniref:alpha/beta fold hydrolase n=1 Tax=Polaromonas sp. TaxID=1869339 RepID=UPI003C8941B0
MITHPIAGRLRALAAVLALAAAVGGCASVGAPAVATGYFFVGGHYAGEGAQRRLQGQMYVQSFEPAHRRHPYPIVMIHGTAQTGNNFTGTPDGRTGWAQEFAARGYAVYVVDQVGRARSGASTALYGEYVELPLDLVQFLARSPDTAFPTARLNTQWPDSAQPGQPIFDQFAAQQVPNIRDATKNEELNLAANLALLERIGPAIVLTHSQSGALGWKLADMRPAQVKALVAIEPNGPSFRDLVYPYRASPPPQGAPWYRYVETLSRPWGITRLALTFSPAREEPPQAQLQAQPDAPELVRCWLQAGTPRTLPQLALVPIGLFTAEASFRTASDHCTARFLEQAGVHVDHIRLAQEGVHGNGHMVMLERNSTEVGAVIARWLQRRSL